MEAEASDALADPAAADIVGVPKYRSLASSLEP